jgi:hypothetical protein
VDSLPAYHEDMLAMVCSQLTGMKPEKDATSCVLLRR